VRGGVKALHAAAAEPVPPFDPKPGTTEREIRAELVLLAMGFLHPEHEGIVAQLGVALDPRGNVKAGTYATSAPAANTPGAASR
jgi:glutamate synthase (NADPH/NADH) small chain